MSEKPAWRQNDSGDITVNPKDPTFARTMSQASERLLALYEIGRQLLEQREPRRVIETIQQSIVAHLQPDSACILSVVKESEYQILSSHHANEEESQKDWPVSHTVLARVSQSGLAVLSLDTESDQELQSSDSVKKHRLKSILCVPMGSHPVKGMIFASRNRQSGFFEPDDLEFLTAISIYASLTLERASEHAKTSTNLRQKSERLSLLQNELLRHEIVGSSPRLLSAYEAVRRFAKGGAKVLLRGETGTGKELFARAYAAASDRSQGAYVPVPIPAMASTLVESELFGHTKGAFTTATQNKPGRLEMADGGVLFLDEVGDITPELQVKLLRFLDSGELYRIGDNVARRVDAYVVSATNRPLEEMVRSERFRADLLARLGQVVEIPPLRERPEDIPLLVQHFLRALDRNQPKKTFSPESLALLKRCRWELNVRQLHHVVERVVYLVDDRVVSPADLAGIVSPSDTPEEASTGIPSDKESFPPLNEIVEEVERRHILQALELCDGNRKEAIALLQISAEKLYSRLARYGYHKGRRRQ